MQIDRIALSKKRDIKIRVGSSKISMKHLESNEKIVDYQDENKRCLKCKMLMDPDEKGICKYCTGDF